MESFTYKEPYIFRDESKNKWCIIYSVKYKGEKNYIRFKEYGKNYLKDTEYPVLNSIVNPKIKEKVAQKLLVLVEMDLKAGIILKDVKTVKAAVEKEIKEAKRKTFDECFTLYLQLKGLVNPIPKKQKTKVTYEIFFKNQVRPFLKEKNLLDDVTKITESHMIDFFNIYYKDGADDAIWSNNTFNNKKGFLSSFFQTLVDKRILDVNPITKIKNVESESTDRFGIFTKEEITILFDHMDKGKHPFIGAVCKLIYHAYIRESELTRLKVRDFNLDDDVREICIEADIAKGQKDKLPRWVKINKSLQEDLKSYLSKYEHQPDWYMFGKRFKPSPLEIPAHWQYLFRDALAEVRLKHPDKFNRDNLSPYSLKHSGVTHFLTDNRTTFSTGDLNNYVQRQCRHESFSMTERYLKKLRINLESFDKFKHL
jgi:integrase